MESVETREPEGVGEAFSVDGMLLARQKTRKAIHTIAKRIAPGMREKDAVIVARDVIKRSGMEGTWHPTRVRFGRNTIKAMREPSDGDVVLGENDIFFIDIAPKLGKWEGDGGATFIVGRGQPQYHRCAQDAERLFHEIRRIWREKRLSGSVLYLRAYDIAKAMGWDLNPDLPGHRISDFPHAAIHDGSLAEFTKTPADMRWVLEIHLLDPHRRFGAFYEDMLLHDSYYQWAAQTTGGVLLDKM